MSPLNYKTITAFCRTKERYRSIEGLALREHIETAQKQLQGTPRFLSKGTWVATYALPSGSVLEVYEDENKERKGFLFLSLDIWLSYPQRWEP